MPRGAALLLIAARFGAVHGTGPRRYDLASEIEVGIAGLWYGILFELSGSLLPAIVAHATWNAIAMWQELAGAGRRPPPPAVRRAGLGRAGGEIPQAAGELVSAREQPL